jgi:hypothetical protein
MTHFHFDPISIAEPHANDVLSGRGAGITKHEGNKRWRELIRRHRQQYNLLPRNQRPIIAESIVQAVRSLSPPGRFLAKDAATQVWYDIGDERATEKTAQAMRDSKKNGKDKVTPTSSRASSPSGAPSTTIHPEGRSSPKCSPQIPKPCMIRESTFDKRLEEMNFAIPKPQLSRNGSGFSLASIDMLEEDEFGLLQESCGMPNHQQIADHHFYSEGQSDKNRFSMR